jgi:hypothetical protein
MDINITREQIRLSLGIIAIVILVFSILFCDLIIVLAGLILFFCILLFNHALEDKKSILSVEKSKIRRVIAITFVLGYIIILFYGVSGTITISDDILMRFVEFLGIVLAFYFGSEAVIVWKRGGS